MENVFKVKVKTNPDPRWLYPSERRYSASIVLGLGVIHLSFALISFLMASLTITTSGRKTDLVNNTTIFESYDNLRSKTKYFDLSTTITLGPCLMCIGAIGAGFTAIIAWKKWYMDYNIGWFFLMSLVSTTTSLICLILVIIIIITNDIYSDLLLKEHTFSDSKGMISINILIASILEVIWSTLSLKISFNGMKNNYPEDIVVPNGGKVEVSTIHRGNLKGKVIPPDILNHYCAKNGIPKCLKKKSNGNLPNDESNAEYYERVNKFLAANIDTNSTG